MIKLDLGPNGVVIDEERFIKGLEDKIERLYAEKIKEFVDEQIEEAIKNREFELYKENIKLKDELLESRGQIHE